MTKMAATKGVACRFVHLSPVNSATVHLMQATDLVTGATWSAWEMRPDTSGKRAAREAIKGQIAAWAGGALTTGFHSSRHYSLWEWKPAKRAHRTPKELPRPK